MTLWLTVAQGSAVVNLLILLVLSGVWLRNYRTHGAKHTLGLLVVAAFLLVENSLWMYFYVFHSGVVRWFLESPVDIQIGVAMLCGLEFGALAVLARITWL